MAITRSVVLVALAFWSSAGSVSAQGRVPLQEITSLKCDFSTMATGDWTADGTPQTRIGERRLTVAFKAINADDGSAEIEDVAGAPSILARLAGGYLHFVQSDSTGLLYTTTVFDLVARAGTLRAVHTRHEYRQVAPPGVASRPEQFYGECEIRATSPAGDAAGSGR